MRPAPPTVEQAIGTIAHNRPFAPRELREYLGDGDDKPLRAWFKKGLLERVGRGLYCPTRLGWWRIASACDSEPIGKVALVGSLYDELERDALADAT